MTYTINNIRTAHDRMMRLFIKDLAKREGEVRHYGRTNWSPYVEVDLESTKDCHYMAELAENTAVAEYHYAKRFLIWYILWCHKRVK